jgi:hypothetical protein
MARKVHAAKWMQGGLYVFCGRQGAVKGHDVMQQDFRAPADFDKTPAAQQCKHCANELASARKLGIKI